MAVQKWYNQNSKPDFLVFITSEPVHAVKSHERRPLGIDTGSTTRLAYQYSGYDIPYRALMGAHPPFPKVWDEG